MTSTMKAANCVGACVVTWFFYTFVNVWNRDIFHGSTVGAEILNCKKPNIVSEISFIFSMANDDGNIYGFSHL